ncbi:TPA: hypothetical protein MA043_000802 [Klebsiella pneumoniae]|uniref:hypothetical protein n=1 Tax=Klebsiella pneumoniae TaxID=573 RepID=UPI0003BEAEBF|nr:hypothetical protein [Klebsiella pneumoniae]ELT7093588.1 hypothetical protein [Klebsiella pneumoniae]EMC5374791.1 hypothetical protein [Klebsiella pneumoniae]ESN37071.1 hypothetical protein L365_02470 [Klebsiella pneumoniae MGH 19]MEA4359299.1 hypothetical protein [Klebsiella pneumoniae]HBT0464261.1 hypothetical protein [Klebsiella pneumoniae]
MTDITELAQREKFEAWFVNDVVGADVTFPAFEDGAYAEGEIYDEQLYFMLQAMWMAWKAAGAELVEALEKAQAGEKQWHELVDAFCADDADWHKLTNSNNELIALLSQVLCKQADRIAELESRTVKLPEPFKLAKSSSGLTYYYADEVDAALTAAGIKVEAE